MSYDLVVEDHEIIRKAMSYEQNSLSKNTRNTYERMWKKFESWCCQHNIVPIPCSVETIALYLSDIAETCSIATIDITIACIKRYHAVKGHHILGDFNLLHRIKRGIRRIHARNLITKQAKALTITDLIIFSRSISKSLRDLRDKTLIIMSFFGAMRRSEAIGLNFDDIIINEKGMTLTLVWTKTSEIPVQIYLGRTNNKEICPIESFMEWKEKSSLLSGPVFPMLKKGGKLTEKRLSGDAVSIIYKRHFGIDYSGHSARRGLITEEAKRGISPFQIAKHSRHKCLNSVMKYVEVQEGFDHSTAAKLGV